MRAWRGGGVIREAQCKCDDAPKLLQPLLTMTDGTRQIDTNYTRPSQ